MRVECSRCGMEEEFDRPVKRCHRCGADLEQQALIREARRKDDDALKGAIRRIR
jgi:ribosomal protein L37E